jgi:glycosyltransferase involved in cell wall biosynthesis
MNLVLFTSTYPFDGGAEQTFLDPELQHLRCAFERVVLVPKKIVGQCLPLPAGVIVDESYARLLSGVKVPALVKEVLTSKLVYQELFSRPSLLLHPSALVRMARFMMVAMLTSQWVEVWLEQNAGSPNVFYTYWFDSSTLGIGLTKRRYPSLRLVSRVHGYDLYEEHYYHPPYWPFRRESLSWLEALFPDSEAGLRYLLQRYPEFSHLYETALLGVTDPGFVTSASADGVFRIVSCSMLVPVKRVDLLLEGILCASRMRPGQKFEWSHRGDGKVRMELQERADKGLPSNAKAFFPGYSNKASLMEFYREHPADVFINVSSTEGTPVSMMEAASCGIPLIATAVGGNPEIVLQKNGVLLSPDPTPEEIAEAIFACIDDPEMAAAQRMGSRTVWRERYNADVNFRAFAERLKSIGEN